MSYLFDISSIIKQKLVKSKRENILLNAEMKYLLIRESYIDKLLMIFYLDGLTISQLKMVIFNKKLNF